MKVKQELLLNKAKRMAESAARLASHKDLEKLRYALEAVFTYIDSGTPDPLTRTEVELLFGGIDRSIIAEVSNALQDRAQRWKKTVEDHQQRHGQSRGQLNEQAKSRSKHKG